MSKIALAPQLSWSAGRPVTGSAARHRGDVPPPHSSVNTTFVPSFEKVAPCQYA